MRIRPFALVFAVVPFALVFYACSSDTNSSSSSPDGGPGTPPGQPPPPGPNPPPPNPPPPPPPPGDGGDAGDASPPTCTGNPLADSGTADASVTLTSGATTQIVLESSTAARGAGTWFLDGVRFLDDGTAGSLVYSSFDSASGASGQLERVLPDGGGWRKLRDTNAGGVGIGNDRKGAAIVTAFSSTVAPNASILRTLPDGGDGGSDLDAGPAVNMNHLEVGPKGDIYFTDARYQSALGVTAGVYRMSPAGVVTAIETGSTAASANRFNGITLSPDATKLYVSLTTTLEIRVYDVAADGAVAVPANKVFVGATAPGGVLATRNGPAGLAVDVGGNVWVAEADVANGASGGVEVFSPAGKLLGEIQFTTTRPTQIAFGGPKNEAVFIATEATGGSIGAIYTYQSRCAGVR